MNNNDLQRLLRANQPAGICAAIAIICGCLCISYWHRWTALDIPINSQAEISTSFTSDLRGTYFAQVAMRRSNDVEQDVALVLPKMTFLVMDENGVRVDQPESGGFFGQTVGKTIAKFPAEPGKRYSVRWQQTANDAAFRKRDPRLQIIVAPDIMKSSVIQCNFLGMFAVASSVFALILFFCELESGKYK